VTPELPAEPITRADALRRGLARYFTRRPCKHGHVAQRRAGNGHCLECDKVWVRAWRGRRRDAASHAQRGDGRGCDYPHSDHPSAPHDGGKFVATATNSVYRAP